MASAMGKYSERSDLQIFIPNVEQRLRLRFLITTQFAATVSGHGKTRAYLNRFKLINDPLCPFNEGEYYAET